MAFRFNKRIKIGIGKGLAINLSKSGITPSVKTKRGSVNSKGYSIRTGVPGINYQKTFSKSKNSGCSVILLSLLLIIISLCKC